MRLRSLTTNSKRARPLAPWPAEEVDSIIISAIQNREVIGFVYEGQPRIVEPQTYGRGTSGERLLRARQIGGGTRSGQEPIAKLFRAQKITELRKTGARFEKALPQHNPNDGAMVEIFATLPKAEP